MKRTLLVSVGAVLLFGANLLAQTEPIAEASRLEVQGHFKEAAGVLTKALESKQLSAATRQILEFELNRLERIKKDFSFTEEQLFDELKQSVKDLTKEEFQHWAHEGRFDGRTIDGRQYYADTSVSNLFFRYSELDVRRLPPKESAALEKNHWETCLAIEKAARMEHRPYVLPKRFQATMTVTAKPAAAPAGELIRAWLPIPRQYPFQGDFDLLSSSPAARQVAPKDSPIRSVYLEQPANKDRNTQFKIEYQYTMNGVWFDINPEEVRPADSTDPALAPFVKEAPHVVFTPEMRALSAQIAGGETNSYLKARKFYDWIAENIKYSYAIEYSTIRNISDYCRTHNYGDCGQEALLFITLCRLNGIPARWQSGWNTFPGAKSIHDWSEIYVAPYGWIPVDPYMGIFAMRYATTLKLEQRREIRDFYFGGLDQYRMIANGDHDQVLNPPKQSMRSDDVDFQRGELEWGTHNLYFDQYSYGLEVKEVKSPSRGLE